MTNGDVLVEVSIGEGEQAPESVDVDGNQLGANER
jgi:hypothetical protein